MNVPKCIPLRRTEIFQKRFGGLSHTASPAPGMFYDMLNVSTDAYPAMSVRKKRAFWRESLSVPGSLGGERRVQGGTITAVGAVNDRICYCTHNAVCYRDTLIDNAGLSAEVKNRTVIPFGRDAFILPDGKYVTPGQNDAPTVIHAAFSSSAVQALISVCSLTGGSMNINYFGNEEPLLPEDNQLWVKNDENGSTVYHYANGSWLDFGKVKLKLSAPNIGIKAKKGDKVFINGLSVSEVCSTVYMRNDDYLVLDCLCLPEYVGNKTLTVEKRIPKMDFAAEHLGRIWGCYYGTDENGAFINEIYASKSGEPTCFDCFEGISTDSYRVSLGCSGEFTGVAKLGQELIFFKENCMIKISGSTPSDFFISVIPCAGVKKGADKSIVTLNGRIYYQGQNGIYVYDSTYPYLISVDLGDTPFLPGFAGDADGKYYICMKNPQGVSNIYVYDPKTGFWCREDDNFHTRFFVKLSGCLYGITEIPAQQTETEAVYCFYAVNPLNAIEGSIFSDTPFTPGEYTYVEEADITWFAQSGRLSVDGTGTQILRSMIFYLEKPAGSSCSVFFAAGQPDFDTLVTLTGNQSGSIALPIRTPRCTSFYVKLSGTGNITLKTEALLLENTSEVKGIVP